MSSSFIGCIHLPFFSASSLASSTLTTPSHGTSTKDQGAASRPPMPTTFVIPLPIPEARDRQAHSCSPGGVVPCGWASARLPVGHST
ncbi:hypothetical protein FA13DRAFT_1150448 [Coprinellus micaceus]|uniref:Secreted protein n=1 Tax=Coprinellus micaceus TaxID=71717 RepID=A0A4Y7SUW9_COPMI|nr:hypothetical protein FA13DRAFT_1150448 [Coprinellus micaceus]